MNLGRWRGPWFRIGSAYHRTGTSQPPTANPRTACSRRRTVRVSDQGHLKATPNIQDRSTIQTDADLVSRTQSGDLCAFNRIVRRYQGQVVNLAARMLGNRANAEDVAQETFISAYRGLGRFRGGSLRAWLLRIAANASRDVMRRGQRRPETSLDESLENPSFQPASEGESPDEFASRHELNAELQRAILALSENHRIVLVLIDVQGLSYEEAADVIGSSVGTVKSRLSRARARVRDALMRRTELIPDILRLDR